MRFVSFALVALIAISSVNSNITQNSIFIKCINNQVTDNPCINAPHQASCNIQLNTFELCAQRNRNCNIQIVTDVHTYVSCLKNCFSPVTDAVLKNYEQSFLNCLSGSFLASVVMTLFALVALLL